MKSAVPTPEVRPPMREVETSTALSDGVAREMASASAQAQPHNDFRAAAGVGPTSQYLEQFGRKLLGGLLGKAAGSRTARKRDVEKASPKKDCIAKLRRLARWRAGASPPLRMRAPGGRRKWN